MRYHLATLAVCVLALVASAAVGEETSPRVAAYPTPSFPFSPPEAWHDHSSTALEGALRGSAVLTQAQGAKSLMDAQARVINQEARARSYENDVDFTYSRFQIKELKEAYRQLQRQRSIARRLKGKQMKSEVEQELANTYRLSDDEFNWKTGAVYWPSWLASPRYAAHRHRISMLLDQMIQYDVARDQFYRDQLARACHGLRDQLREDAAVGGNLTDQQYLAAQRFIVGLKYAPHLLDPTMGELVAMNAR